VEIHKIRSLILSKQEVVKYLIMFLILKCVGVH
jgi:hypothetical protein